MLQYVRVSKIKAETELLSGFHWIVVLCTECVICCRFENKPVVIFRVKLNQNYKCNDGKIHTNVYIQFHVSTMLLSNTLHMQNISIKQLMIWLNNESNRKLTSMNQLMKAHAINVISWRESMRPLITRELKHC